MDPVAARRIIRLGFGTALALWISQGANWGLSFIAPVLLCFLLAVPMPAPRLKQGLSFVLALLAYLIREALKARRLRKAQ